METTTTYQGKKQETHDSYSFYFAKPAGFDYAAGQFMFITIPHQADERGIKRHFSLSSAPTESNLMITTKITDSGSSYKQALLNLPEGTELAIRGPHGEFTLPADESQAVVFLGGGIGITPFRSMIKLAADKGSPRPITLLYANKTPGDIIYKSEFDGWAQANQNFKVAYAVDTPTPDWGGEVGHLTADLIKKYVPDTKQTLYYICGPAGMIEAYTNVLTELGLDGDHIVTEDFSGY